MVASLDWSTWLLAALLAGSLVLGMRRDRAIAAAAILVMVLPLPEAITMAPGDAPLLQLLAAGTALIGMIALAIASPARWPLAVAALAIIATWSAFWTWAGLAPTRASAIMLRGCELAMAAVLLRVAVDRSSASREPG